MYRRCFCFIYFCFNFLQDLGFACQGENAYAQRRRVHEKRHRDAIQNKKQEEQEKDAENHFQKVCRHYMVFLLILD